MTHVISFDVSKRDEDGVTVITPVIDGVLLSDMAARFEESHRMKDPAGGYGGLIPEFFRYGRLDRYFLGRPEDPLTTSAPGRIFVLGCECGEVGCWPLVCEVDARDDAVVWAKFEQPHRPARDYSEFGPFVFERNQYDNALRSLPEDLQR